MRHTNSGLLSMMDAPEMRGLASYLSGRRWHRDDDGHGEGGDDDSGGEDDAEDEDLPDQDDKAEGDEDKEDGKEDEDDTEDDDKPKYSEREYDKLKRRLAASDKKQGDLQKIVNDLRAGNKDKIDAEVRKELDALKPVNDKLAKDNKDLRMRLAFLSTTVKGVEWHDADAAMRLVDLSDVDIDPETGAVDTRDLASAMRRLAKDKPYLVKKKRTATAKGDEDQSSGSRMNGSRKGSKGGADKAALAKRFPSIVKQ